jgi:hypothetical protein
MLCFVWLGDVGLVGFGESRLVYLMWRVVNRWKLQWTVDLVVGLELVVGRGRIFVHWRGLALLVFEAIDVLH